MIALLLATLALGQDFSFPTSTEDYEHFYPTAYYDHSGVDWACGQWQYSGHRGSDFGGGGFAGQDAGRDITAAADGMVTATNDGEYDRCTTGDCDGGGGYGNYVMIRHADGRETLYGHLRQWSVAVEVGQGVRCGDKLGEMGSSGHSTGPHLHFEVRSLDDEQVDAFHGECSSLASAWVDQGEYMGLPAIACDDPPPPCEPIATLTCGDVVTGTNDMEGSTSEHVFYGCADWVYTGPELVYEVVSSLDEDVTVRVDGLSGDAGDLDLYVLASAACDGVDAITCSDNNNGEYDHEVATWAASAGVPAVVVVDGWQGGVSPFTLTVQCEGRVESGETADTDDTGPSTDHPPRPLGERVRLTSLGCRTVSGGPWFLVPLTLAWRRRWTR